MRDEITVMTNAVPNGRGGIRIGWSPRRKGRRPRPPPLLARPRTSRPSRVRVNLFRGSYVVHSVRDPADEGSGAQGHRRSVSRAAAVPTRNAGREGSGLHRNRQAGGETRRRVPSHRGELPVHTVPEDAVGLEQDAFEHRPAALVSRRRIHLAAGVLREGELGRRLPVPRVRGGGEAPVDLKVDVGPAPGVAAREDRRERDVICRAALLDSAQVVLFGGAGRIQ